jgi:hypothetical protein
MTLIRLESSAAAINSFCTASEMAIIALALRYLAKQIFERETGKTTRRAAIKGTPLRASHTAVSA